MSMLSHSSRWTAGLLATTLALATLVPAAQADRGGSWVRYKHGGSDRSARVVRYDRAPQRVYVQRSSSVGPALVGFLGGLVVGSAIHSHPVNASAAVDYNYWDPYCHRSYASRDAYYSHSRYAHHPRLVRVIEVDSGDCVRSEEYCDGRWYERAPNFRASYDQRSYEDQRSYDDRCDEDWDN